MNILLIGNGFDLAHGLPTSYMDFLKFCQCVTYIFVWDHNATFQEFSRKCDEMELDEDVQGLLVEVFKQRKFHKMQDNAEIKVLVENSLLNEIRELIDGNVWYQYFVNVCKLNGKNWIDFENEISKIIQYFDFNGRREKEKTFYPAPDSSNSFIGFLNIASRKINQSGTIPVLENDLKQIRRAIELYLLIVEKACNIKPLTQIENLNIDCILSFNYTNTYANCYGDGKDITYCYIHGRINENHNIDSNNLVLGIDEYLEDTEKDRNLTYISFKKYFQRIVYNTGVEYYSWIEKIKSRREFSKGNNDYFGNDNLYIFGHSLDPTDGDVLRKIINAPGIHTHIFYHRQYENDNRNLGKLVRNLVKVLGQDNVVKMCGEGVIAFVPQEINE